MNQLESLKRFTTIVADTGNVDEIESYKPEDATTNPSLILQAAGKEEYRELVDEALAHADKHAGNEDARVEAFMDRVFVNFGRRILDVVPGRVSTEVDARLSFDVRASVAKGRRLIELYEEEGIPRERVLIKLASTWEGIRAGEILEREGIHCNMTLLFGLVQAAACAEAGATLISPFVGRIYDWYKKSRGVSDIALDEDPGVESVTQIWTYLKSHGYPIQVMGASFRKSGQVVRLAGCDLLTVSPELLAELSATKGDVPERLGKALLPARPPAKLDVSEASFRWLLNEDAMATEKLAEGIRRFHADSVKLERFARENVGSAR